jgi:hypothetical protein
MDVPLKHIIGTVALISLVIAVGLAYTLITYHIEAEVTRKQLEQIAEYVSLNLVEIVSLVNLANYSGNVQVKIIEIPEDLGGKAYMIRLTKEAGRGYCVEAQLSTRKDIVASSPVPINSTETQLKLITEDEGTLKVRGEAKAVYYSGAVYGGAHDVVVWGEKVSLNVTWAGIGLLKPLGG